jgi:hypothetical protein
MSTLSSSIILKGGKTKTMANEKKSPSSESELTFELEARATSTVEREELRINRPLRALIPMRDLLRARSAMKR